MIKKVKGVISLPSGEKFLGGDLEIDEKPALIDAETASFLCKAWQNARNIAENFSVSWQICCDEIIDGRPVVESTLAEKGEGSNA